MIFDAHFAILLVLVNKYVNIPRALHISLIMDLKAEKTDDK